MTAQISDYLIENDTTFLIKPYPLEELGGSWKGEVEFYSDIPLPRFRRVSTNCSRGYHASWSIIKGKLFQVGFLAYEHTSEIKPLSIKDVFGVNQLFAFWYSGELQSNQGLPLSGAPEPIFERTIVWQFEYGLLSRKFVRENGVAYFPNMSPPIRRCYFCGDSFDVRRDQECTACRWTKCACGRCGCNFPDAQNLLNRSDS